MRELISSATVGIKFGYTEDILFSYHNAFYYID